MAEDIIDILVTNYNDNVTLTADPAVTVINISNLTGLTGIIVPSGTVGIVPYYDTTTTFGNSNIFTDGTSVGINNNTPTFYSTNRGMVVRNPTGNVEVILQHDGNTANSIQGLSISAVKTDAAYIFQRENLPLKFGTNDTLRLTIAGSGAATFTGSLTTNGAMNVGGVLTVTGSSLFGGLLEFGASGYIKASASLGFLVNNSADTLNNFISYDNGNAYVRGNFGVGTTSAGGKFEVYAGASGATAVSNGSHFILQNSAAVGMSLLSPDANASRINFGTASNNRNAIIYSDYNAGSQTLTFSVGSGATSATERMRLNSSGYLLLGTTTDDTINIFQANGSIKSTQFRLSALNTAPSSASDTGVLGEIRIDASYIYICTATNTWKRSAIITW